MTGHRYQSEVVRIDERTMKIRFVDLHHQRKWLTWRDVVYGWQSRTFTSAFSRAIGNSPWEAFFWETPGLIGDDLDSVFECVTIASPTLAAARADMTSFALKVARISNGNQVSVFPNLRKDATLIVPNDVDGKANYAHIGAFVRTASSVQIENLWAAVAEVLCSYLADGRRFWLSTSGLGVPWLHVRIDDSPKYYSYEPYRTITTRTV